MSSAVSRCARALVLPVLLLAVPAPPLFALPAEQPVSVTGTVRDATGAAVPRATVSLLDAQRAIVASGRTDDEGRYSVGMPVPGRYIVLFEARGFAERTDIVELRSEASAVLDVSLSLRPVEETVTVTAYPGVIEDVETIPQAVNLINREEIELRAKAVAAQVAEGEVGVHLQRTSPTMAGIYVRGFTGNKVNIFVDGVRYTTGAQRGGVNTFLNLNDPADQGSVEILRGPSSTQYGSDAIGGSVQFLPRPLSFSGGGRRFSGAFGTSFGSADVSYGSDVTAAWAGETVAMQGTFHGRRVNTLRPGDEVDTHNAVTRFLGVSSDLVLDDGRLPDTAFTQYGGSFRAAWAVSPLTQVTASYRRGQQDGGKRYDQLLGGDGNLVADLRNLMMDLATVRLERRSLGWFDAASIGYSFNTQREERVNQGGNGNPRASINHEYERTSTHGMQGSLVKQAGRHALTLGGDYYSERVDAPSFGFNPVSTAVTVRRGRVPDEARYKSGGIFLQDVWEPTEDLDVVASVRWNGATYDSDAADSPIVNDDTLWPDDHLTVDRVTFRAGAAWRPVPSLTVAGTVSTGFRAPHVTDLGTLGLTGSGFEVSFQEVEGRGATVGTTAGAGAVSSGLPVEQQKPERSLSYEGALRWHTSRFDTDLVAFVNNVDDNITKQTLILPEGAVGTTLGDQVITSQNANGAVFVPVATNPVLVRANFDDARVWGIEHTSALRLASSWRVSTVFTYLKARDKRTDLPPNIEGGTPAPEAWINVRWEPSGKGYWVEPYTRLVGRNDDLSTLDLEDRRTGATRSRNSIASFFNNGARARGLVDPGPDGAVNTPDDFLIATGETVAQIQDRVLGVGVDSAPLLTEIPGYALFGVRAGFRFGGRHQVLVDFENITDESYRGVSWGLDGPGRNLYVRYNVTF
jgi:outer membrane receptor protein involved in Fe transport